MKKMLSLLFLSSSLFSMQLALKMQTTRFDRVKFAVLQQQKAIISQGGGQTTSKDFTMPKELIDSSSIRASHSLSDIKLYYGKKGFVVLRDDKKHVIEKCFMNEMARSITKEGLKSFLKKGYFVLKQSNDGTFMLKAHHRLNGGRPILGGWRYLLTKSVCYGALIAAGVSLVVATGGAVF